ncbi:Serine/threonine-protein kinase PknB [Planctomycetes bacterium Pla163]|uniref:Serine/threonine-protein kinase PknB n=1 Tax=Rohdeia mirabilis TaxID=2528008 RepID=A0A518CV86_9BACT|nr:Serine/threonine-protein kinase PknB [Planctomycetes bacterium Pla163]
MTRDDDPARAARDEADAPDVARVPVEAGVELGEAAGAVIDRYTLLEPIGEGGMGTVWRASQTEPVKREVALKVIKLGMDTREVVVRFEAERQALALMDHPGIAKVIDGGATASGRPYFVMELVQGAPITDFCREHQLGLRARLELFGKVCEAVQHAHHKGVIHRDLKPSNVLVSMGDNGPQPKVIDFGIAKATSAELTNQTMFTQAGQIIGTPEYMAPEQAGMDGADIDTRADVYSLGVLLYELLTGTKPFDMRVALQTGYDELLRQIREVDPAKPSTRVSSLSAEEATTAITRRVNVETLSRRLRGDLDWVVMKAIEKDRTRRYDTPTGLADDVARYLRQEPVTAAPPSATYRFRTFVKRRRKTVAAIATIAVVLVGGLAGTGYGLVEARRANDELAVANESLEVAIDEKQDALQVAQDEREAAERELARATEFKSVVADLFLGVQPSTALDKDTELLETLLRSTSDQLLAGGIVDEYVASELNQLLGTTYNVLSVYDRAERHLAEALAFAERRHARDSIALAWARVNWAQLLTTRGDLDAAVALYETVLADLPEPVPGPLVDPIHLTVHLDLSHTYLAGGWHEGAQRHLDAYFELVDAGAPTDDGDEFDAMTRQLMVYTSAGENALAVEMFDEVLEPWAGEVDVPSPQRAYALGVVAKAHRDLGDMVRAEEAYLEQLDIYARTLAPNNAVHMSARSNYADFLSVVGRSDEALAILEEVAPLSEATLGTDHPDHVRLRSNLGRTLTHAGRPAEAVRVLTDVVDGYTRLDGPDATATIVARGNLAIALYDRGGEDQRVRDELTELIPLFDRVLGTTSGNTINARLVLGDLLWESGDQEAALVPHRAVLAARRESLGDDHPDTINTLHRLGDRLLVLSRFDDAIEAFTEARERGLRVLGSEHRSVLGITTNLGMCLTFVGRPEDAVELLEPNAETKLRVLGIVDPWTHSCFRQLASAHVRAGDVDAADAVARRLLDLQSDYLLEHADDWMQLVSFAMAYLDPEVVAELDPARATALIERALAHGGDDHPEPYATLAHARAELGDLAGAVEAAETAIELAEEPTQVEDLTQLLAAFRAALESD